MEKANSSMVVRDDAAQPHPLLLPGDLANNPLQNISPNQLAQVKKSAMIQCIKTFPALWDSNDPSAKNASYCKLLWDNISEVLKIEVRQAKINWGRLRNSYKKYYLARKGGKKPVRNKWLESLNFLENEIIQELKKDMTVIETLKKTSTGIRTENEVSVEIICCDSDDEDDCQIVETNTNDSIGTGKASKLEESNTPVRLSPLKPSANALNTNKPLIRPRKMEELLKLSPKNNSSKTTIASIDLDAETTHIRTNNTDVSVNEQLKPFSVNVNNGITEEVIMFKPTQSHVDKLDIVVSNASSVENSSVQTTSGGKSIVATPAKKRPLGMTKVNTKCVEFNNSTLTEDPHQRQFADRSIKKVRMPDKPDTGSKSVEKSSLDTVSITQVSSTNQMAQETPKSIGSTSMQQEPSGPVVTSSQPEEGVMLIDDDFKINEATDDNGNLTFLQSLLPDIYSMNFAQFRTFKKHSTFLASMILDL